MNLFFNVFVGDCLACPLCLFYASFSRGQLFRWNGRQQCRKSSFGTRSKLTIKTRTFRKTFHKTIKRFARLKIRRRIVERHRHRLQCCRGRQPCCRRQSLAQLTVRKRSAIRSKVEQPHNSATQWSRLAEVKRVAKEMERRTW